MPELDLSLATDLRIAGYDALAVRIANVDVWEREASSIEHTIFGSDALTGYQLFDDLPTNGWLGANFYTTGIPQRVGWEIVGARIWIPLDYTGPALGASGYVAVHRVSDSVQDTPIGVPGAPSHEQIINGFDTNGSKTAFTSLHVGWNDVYFDQTWPLKHGNGFAIGYQIGDGRYYTYASGVDDILRRASDGTNLFLSEANSTEGEPKAGEFGVPPSVGAAWTAAHYGIDVIVREPPTMPTGEHSIWGNELLIDSVYRTNNDLGTGGWTTSHFYSVLSESEPTENWELVGARLWLPDGTIEDPHSLAGKSAVCGYYVQPSGIIGDPGNTPLGVINQIAASPLASTTLIRGWNTVYFDTPIPVPWGAGIAIGWQIDDGSYYISARMGDEPIQSLDGSPFYLAGSELDSERRGTFTLDTDNALWAYQDYHYGGDLILKKVA
ncbi:MAG: hypothetical protein ACREGE_00855 [Candidatus Microsaccharimonas sp.]